jgi:uncharacterized protein (DUF4415 family)
MGAGHGILVSVLTLTLQGGLGVADGLASATQTRFTPDNRFPVTVSVLIGITKDFFDRAEIRDKGQVVRPAKGTLTHIGRPPLGRAAKKQVTLRLDADVVEAFKAGGAGWQTRMNDVLAKAMNGLVGMHGGSVKLPR